MHVTGRVSSHRVTRFVTGFCAYRYNYISSFYWKAWVDKPLLEYMIKI